ncbi:E3 Ubiquitin-Protein Ligase Arkadia [Manis pentadactyla]|nr:E3 Ubiquitin-Protein Ligase Arkadia [Manis pentadactyla]
MQRFRPNPAEVVDLTADDDDDEPTAVPLTSSTTESPTTSPSLHNYSESPASEQASDSESTDDSSEWSETSAPRTSNRMTGTYTGVSIVKANVKIDDLEKQDTVLKYML